jgi:hypothetical protein
MALLSPATRRLLLVLAAAALAAHALTASAQESPAAVERQVKAAFLYKFGGYVTWPENAFARADSPVVIGVAGADLLAEELSKVSAGRTVGERPITVRRVGRGETLSGVHILFAGSGAGRPADFIDPVRGRPVLTVTESESTWPSGSVVNFAVVDNRVRFDVALDAAEQNGLRLSALLLSVARQVKGR